MVMELNRTFFCYQVSQLVSQLFKMRTRMQKMMAGMQGKDTPDMDNLMESIKSEEQVKAPPARGILHLSLLCLVYEF